MDEFTSIIIDDEVLSIKMLEDLLQQISEIRNFQSFSRPKDAVNYLIDNPEVDLIFLDIRMPQMSGFDFLKELQQYSFITPNVI